LIDRNEETAFPVTVGQVAENHWGMSLRDWFAGMALQSFLSPEPETLSEMYCAALTAYQMADEMMEARKEAKQ